MEPEVVEPECGDDRLKDKKAQRPTTWPTALTATPTPKITNTKKSKSGFFFIFMLSAIPFDSICDSPAFGPIHNLKGATKIAFAIRIINYRTVQSGAIHQVRLTTGR